MGWAAGANRLRLITQFSPLEKKKKKKFLWESISKQQSFFKELPVEKEDAQWQTPRMGKMPMMSLLGKHTETQYTNTEICYKESLLALELGHLDNFFLQPTKSYKPKYITLVINQYWLILQNVRIIFLFFVLCCCFLLRALKSLNNSLHMVFVLVFISSRFY